MDAFSHRFRGISNRLFLSVVHLFAITRKSLEELVERSRRHIRDVLWLEASCDVSSTSVPAPLGNA